MLKTVYKENNAELISEQNHTFTQAISISWKLTNIKNNMKRSYDTKECNLYYWFLNGFLSTYPAIN